LAIQNKETTGKTIGMLVFSVEACGFIQLSGQTRQQNLHATLSSKGKVYLAWSLDDVSCPYVTTFLPSDCCFYKYPAQQLV